jgi:GDP-mannose pyrophosphatase NudK
MAKFSSEPSNHGDFSMRELVVIEKQDVLADSWGVLKRTTLRLLRRSGEWQTQVRETYDRGHGAAILLFNRAQGTVVLTRQFRFPAWYNGEGGWLIEVPAGKLDGDDPLTCAKKEAEEETGFRVTAVEQVFMTYMSPGSVTEKVAMFLAEYDATSRVSAGGGLADEGEDIEVLELPFTEAMRMIATGEIADAKTVMLLQHLALSGRMAG